MFSHTLAHTRYKVFIAALGVTVALTFLTIAVINAVFTSPIDLTTNPAGKPVIDADGAGVIHAAWEERTATGRDIIYAQSTDDGLTFPGGSRINISSTVSLTSTSAQIKVDSADNIHIVWEEDEPTSGEAEVYYVKSTDGGTTFSARLNISSDSLFSGSPYIETSAGDKIHITWTNSDPTDEIFEVYYASSGDGGATFSTPVSISNVTTHDVDKPIVRADDNFIIVIWQAEGGEFGLYRVISSDNGVSFGTALNIGGDTTTQINDPTIGIDGDGTIHIAAASFATSQPEIMYFRSQDGGVTFDAGVNLSNSLNDISANPKVGAVGKKTVFVGWSENICDVDGCTKSILVRKSTNGGNTFQSASSPDEAQVLASVKSLDFDIFGLNLYLIWSQSGAVQFMKGTF